MLDFPRYWWHYVNSRLCEKVVYESGPPFPLTGSFLACEYSRLSLLLKGKFRGRDMSLPRDTPDGERRGEITVFALQAKSFLIFPVGTPRLNSRRVWQTLVKLGVSPRLLRFQGSYRSRSTNARIALPDLAFLERITTSKSPISSQRDIVDSADLKEWKYQAQDNTTFHECNTS